MRKEVVVTIDLTFIYDWQLFALFNCDPLLIIGLTSKESINCPRGNLLPINCVTFLVGIRQIIIMSINISCNIINSLERNLEIFLCTLPWIYLAIHYPLLFFTKVSLLFRKEVWII